ncbi:hypothetical protein [Nocardia salmonicida]|uniref:hypothetical protein n=1 Tax=Nocardia salmonicida TaxID=53431 RepID=UPI00363B2C2B
MSPDRGQRQSSRSAAEPAPIKIGPSSADSYEVVYFRRPSNGQMPGREFINALPTSLRARVRTVLAAVAAAPPMKFSGGGYWEAMHDEMTGWYELRCRHRNTHYRVFCRLDSDAIGRDKPLLVIFDGRSKPLRTAFSDSEYAEVRELGEEYFAVNPRPLG